MFGFGKRKSDPPKPERPRRSAEGRERKSQNMAQLGFLAGVGDDGDIDNLMGNMDVGDDDLEEELAMLLEGNQTPVRRPKTSPAKRSSGVANPSVGIKSARNAGKIDVDLENDELDQDDDDIDLNDPDLEAELGDILGVPTVHPNKNVDSPMDDEEDDSSEAAPPPSITGEELIKLLQDRLELYEKAKAAADSVGESAKARRFTRGIKTLKELIPKAKAGRVISESDIPPVVSIGVIKREGEGVEQPMTEIPPSSSQAVPKVPPRSFKAHEPESMKSTEVLPPNPAEAVPITIDSDNTSCSLPEPLIPIQTFTPQPTPVSVDTIEPAPTPSIVPQQVEVTPVTVDPLLEERLKDYKLAAVSLKRQGDVQGALKYLRLAKTLETSIKSGEAVDLSNFPAVESISQPEVSNDDSKSTVGQVPPSQDIVSVAPVGGPAAVSIEPVGIPVAQSAPSDDIFGAPPPPKSVMEALEQRLQKYHSEVEKATAASNSSKARRMGRIVKQYEDAIKLYKKGKPVPFDELPTPPGFAPIPVAGAPTPQPQPQQPEPESKPQIPAVIPTPTSIANEPSSVGSPENTPKAGTSGTVTRQSPASTSGGSVSRSGKPTTKLTLQEKQLQIITLRQQQFKEAALNAKQRGDVNQAREFLRTAKGFDKLIQVAQAGLPVDMATLPIPPEAVAKLELEDSDNFEVVSASDCIMPSGSAAEIFPKLENDLKQQLKMCMRTRDHFKSIGDVASANRFEAMALESKKDLDALRLAMKKGSDIPKYHYENRIFSITECNTDVGDNEIEISILSGINYKVSNPADVDTFVKIELPYPSSEEMQTNKTHVVKDTNNPEYNATFKMSINRTARTFLRFVHRNGFKCEVWSRGGLCSGGFFFCACHRGFLRGNTLIGTASVKLLPLETKCTLHDAFDIMDGRKNVGKLEVRVKIREPVLTKQITQKKEKWLSIDRI